MSRAGLPSLLKAPSIARRAWVQTRFAPCNPGQVALPPQASVTPCLPLPPGLHGVSGVPAHSVTAATPALLLAPFRLRGSEDIEPPSKWCPHRCSLRPKTGPQACHPGIKSTASGPSVFSNLQQHFSSRLARNPSSTHLPSSLTTLTLPVRIPLTLPGLSLPASFPTPRGLSLPALCSFWPACHWVLV